MKKKIEQNYEDLLSKSVSIIEQIRTKIAVALNRQVSNTYYEIGRLLFERKLDSKHGSAVIERLASDLKNRYPQMGFSPRNLWDMKHFFAVFSQKSSKLRQAVAVLPWSHNLLMLHKDLSDNAILFYANEIVSKGWSRKLLLKAIKMQYHLKAENSHIYNNFKETLPKAQAEFANESIKCSVNLGFLGPTEPIRELELEQRLIDKIKQFLLELGKGFSFIGNQYALDYNGKESKVDMLFFHRGLKSLVAIDLKIGEFKPEYVGKTNYYLSVLDRIERREDENQSIGIILCASKDHVDVQLSLEGVNKPIAVADYQLLIPQEKLKKVIENEMKNADGER